LGSKGKIALAVIAALAVLLALNTVAVDNETKGAKVTMVGGRILQLPSGSVQVVETGPEDGRPIVLLHCFTCSSRWWDGVVPDLAAKHRVIRIDLRGHGGSEKPSDGYSMEEQAALVAAALAELDVKRATVVGHSLGGTVAVALAEQSPELVRRLVIVGQAPNNDDFGELDFAAQLSFTPVVGQLGWRITPRFVWKDGLGQAFAPGYEVPDEFVDDLRRMTYAAYNSSATAEDDYVDAEPLNERLVDSDIPLLVIFGAEERIYDVPEAPDAYREVPGARIELVEGAGHSPNVEKPAETAALILDFIRRSRGQPRDEAG